MWHINFASGGLSSWYTGQMVAEKHGTARLIHLFTDTRDEDPDLYRFLREGCKHTGGLLVEIADGRNLWELFESERFIGNTAHDICSRILKRDLARDWVRRHFKPHQCRLYFGITASERHRYYGRDFVSGIRRNWQPYTALAPLVDRYDIERADLFRALDGAGIDPPALYDEGFKHNNCGGFCVKGGHAGMLHLLRTRPTTFFRHARAEFALRNKLYTEHTVMSETVNGVKRPLPMLEFARQVKTGERVVNMRDYGTACQCFTE